MILARRKADINRREDTEMVAFIAIVGMIVGIGNMGFQQGQANPDAKSFFQSSAHIVHNGSADNCSNYKGPDKGPFC
jgi:hypothetical protein